MNAPQFPPGGKRSEAVLCRLGLEKGNFILAVGRLVPEKGLHDLIDAFEARTAGPARKLLIAGGADHGSPYACKLLDRASDNVIFAGIQSHDVLKTLYDHCALFVLPSYHEGLPIAALEAASCSAPIALSDIPANRDLGFGEAHYFPAGDVSQLSKILEGPFEALVGDVEVVRRRFDWDRSAIITAKIYRGFASAATATYQEDPVGSGLVD